MAVLTKGSLKFRLISGFLFCAFLTALSGGAGIFSLGKIRAMMADTSRLINENIDAQNLRIHQLMPVRDLVTQTLEAETIQEISSMKDRCQALTEKLNSASDLKGIYDLTLDLMATKTLQLNALDRLKESRLETSGILDEIIRLTRSSAKATQEDSVEAVEGELARLSQKAETMAKGSLDLDDTIDELMMTSEMSISAVRAALSVQAVTIRQQVLTNALYHAASLTALEQIRKEMLTLQGSVNSELVELPEGQTTQTLITSLTAFSDVVTAMFTKKTEELAAGTSLREKAGQITRDMTEVDLQLMGASEKLKSNVNGAMETSGSLIRNWQTLQAVLAVAAMAMALGIGFLASALIIRPIQRIIEMLKDIAQGEGDLTRRLDDSGRDEMAEMARWFNTFIKKIQEMIRKMADNTLVLEDRANTLLSLAGTLSQGASTTSATSETVLASARQTSENMTAMDQESREASGSIQSISAAVEQMTISVDDIARNASESGQISEKAVAESRMVLEQVESLNLSAGDIGKVIQVIREISEQTHLLALNATIEAARAGEAGRGFAVVADEIKDLALQTSSAIGDIKTRVEAIQSAARLMDQGIGGVSGTITRTNDSMAAIVSSVEEQSATTKEIAGNLAQAARGIEAISHHVSTSSTVSRDIAKEVGEVSRTAESITQDSARVNDTAGQLTDLAKTLKNQAAQFTI
jgi:methyl-accepting chemotaxis protein